ncbi:hypothetical protein C4572_04125 [Candidatus Parcubacteria bacterium]|nr:MAG: hypothetical protein C4572_04125 [Candidatus Parcubacteria bacterium]
MPRFPYILKRRNIMKVMWLWFCLFILFVLGICYKIVISSLKAQGKACYYCGSMDEVRFSPKANLHLCAECRREPCSSCSSCNNDSCSKSPKKTESVN